MAEINTKISYDKEEDILDLSRGIQSKASIEVGDFVIDIDFEGKVSSLEILNASENLNLNNELLEQVKEASMSVFYKPNSLSIILSMKFQEKEKEVVIPLSINLGHKTIKKEETLFAR
ncbi:DUF2283 domain-containing protein [Candidatus Pacearchaeota archaeon]|nr:DUF2283 domain-containing protein [Candidatus Pacearchaeota archaeon]